MKRAIDQLRTDRRLSSCLEQLRDAAEAADALGLDRWEFAVEIAAVLGTGSNRTHLRFAVAAGWAHHARETARSGARVRQFRSEIPLGFGPHTCFVLTDAGLAALESAGSTPSNPETGSVPDAAASSMPFWDADARELYLDRRLVKQFRRPAPRLELVLSAFQESNWPRHLDDPLPPEHGVVCDERLRDTVRRLNCCQSPRLIRFTSNGLGTGLRWDRPRMNGG